MGTLCHREPPVARCKPNDIPANTRTMSDNASTEVPQSVCTDEINSGDLDLCPVILEPWWSLGFESDIFRSEMFFVYFDM